MELMRPVSFHRTSLKPTPSTRSPQTVWDSVRLHHIKSLLNVAVYSAFDQNACSLGINPWLLNSGETFFTIFDDILYLHFQQSDNTAILQIESMASLHNLPLELYIKKIIICLIAKKTIKTKTTKSVYEKHSPGCNSSHFGFCFSSSLFQKGNFICFSPPFNLAWSF